MSIPLQIKVIDLLNLVVAKGATFLVTVTVFSLLSRTMSGHAFADFAYWWSIAAMIGGVLLGGIASAMVRVVSTSGTLAHLKSLSATLALALIVVAGLAWPLSKMFPSHATPILLLASAAVFGAMLQVQTAILTLLRALQATWSNLIASGLIIAMTPATLAAVIYLAHVTSLAAIFFALSAIFALGAAAAFLVAWPRLGPLFLGEAPIALNGPFIKNALSFTTINIFSYGATNIDFSLFKAMQSPGSFTVMANAKVYFERFTLPALLVLAGAVSLTVLRYAGGAEGVLPKLIVRRAGRLSLLTVALWIGLTCGYWVFVRILRPEPPFLPVWASASLSAGYIAYAFNAILLDVLVVRRTLSVVAAYLAAFLATDTFMQLAGIHFYGIAGWALMWPIFNSLVLIVLSHECLQLHSE